MLISIKVFFQQSEKIMDWMRTSPHEQHSNHRNITQQAKKEGKAQQKQGLVLTSAHPANQTLQNRNLKKTNNIIRPNKTKSQQYSI